MVEPLSIRTLNLVHKDATNLPPIPPSSTPAPCKYRTQFKSLNIHRIFGCLYFRNQKHLTAATNSSLVDLGILPSTIGSFATIANPPKGEPIKNRLQYLEKFHMYIAFGDCLASRVHHYALLLVDVASIYCWLYGISHLSSTPITFALKNIKSEAGRLPRRFRSIFDRKLMGGNVLCWILSNI